MNGHHFTFHHVPPRQECYPLMNSFCTFYGEPNHPHLQSTPTFAVPNTTDMNPGDSFDASAPHMSKRNFQKNHYVKSNSNLSPRKESNFKHSFPHHVPIRNPVIQQ